MVRLIVLLKMLVLAAWAKVKRSVSLIRVAICSVQISKHVYPVRTNLFEGESGVHAVKL